MDHERERDRQSDREGRPFCVTVCLLLVILNHSNSSNNSSKSWHSVVLFLYSTIPHLHNGSICVSMCICVCVDVWLTGSESVSARLCVCESVSLAVALAVVVPCRAAVVLVFRVVHGVFRKNRGRSTKTPKSRSNDHMRLLHTPFSDKEISSIHSTKSKSHSTALHCIGPHCIRLD